MGKKKQESADVPTEQEAFEERQIRELLRQCGRSLDVSERMNPPDDPLRPSPLDDLYEKIRTYLPADEEPT